MKAVDIQSDAVRREPQTTDHPAERSLLAWRTLLLVLLLSLLTGVMAYQAPPDGRVLVGWLGDQLFLASNAGLGGEAIAQGEFYPDDLTPDSPTSRSRWTREQAQVTLPNLGQGADIAVSLLLQGWPDDVVGATVTQPEVAVRVGDTVVATIRPTPEWAEHRFVVPATARVGADLTLRLTASQIFTDTLRGADPRPKGVRLAAVDVSEAATVPAVLPPAWSAVALLVAAVLLLYVLLARLVRAPAPVYVITTVGAGVAGIGLALARLWMGAVLGVAIWVLVAALMVTWGRPLLAFARTAVRRYTLGRSLSYGVVAAALAWLGFEVARLSQAVQAPGLYLVRETFPDSLLYGLLGAGLLALVLVLGHDGLPRLANALVTAFNSRRGAVVLLALFGAIWIGYQAAVVRGLPYVGHADYADNAVVARNLAAGRGWVVDYVTQFYRLYDSVTHPQETWPLLQPVWIAPFFAVFGAESWVAKLPNLMFNSILLVLVYQIGAHIWSRRVGLLAALFTLTNFLFFRLTIYATSDLAFVVFSVAAVYLLYRGTGNRGQGTGDRGQVWYLVGSGVLTGLMMLQKPSGAMIAVGMGLFLLMMLDVRVWRPELRTLRHLRVIALAAAAWGLVAFVVLSPYLVRNLMLFDKPVFSTESYDAWVLGYRGNSGTAWEDIYRIYTPELGGPGVPDRSWILRWGFDYTWAKFTTQVDALRDYLMPVWRGVPNSAAWLFSSNEGKNIVSPLGAWFALLGVIAALRFRRRLLSLLVFSFAPYIVFMLTYWRTNEERYWVMLVPWLALLVAWMIWAGYDRLASIGDGRWTPLGLILVCVAVVGVVGPSWPDIVDKVQEEPQQWQPDLVAYEWIKANTAPGDVMMTRVPWQLNWHTERGAVMIPNTADQNLFFDIAKRYGADYLVLENLLRVKGDSASYIDPLVRPGDATVGTVIDGFQLVYASPTEDFRVFIYRFPEQSEVGFSASK